LLRQKKHNGNANKILTLDLNGLPVCYCDAQPAGPHISLDAWWMKDNLHYHTNVREIVLVYVVKTR
jgi:hypothetical protein